MTLVEAERGRYGAKRASFSEGYRDIILKIHKASPRASIERITPKIREAMLKNFQALDAMIIHTATNIIAAEIRENKPYTPRSPAPTIKERVETLAVEKVRRAVVNLKDHIMPDGRRLGDYSGDDCTRMGGRWTALGKKIGPTGTIEKNATQADLKPFFKRP